MRSTEYGWFDEQKALEVIAKSKASDDPEISIVKKTFDLLSEIDTFK